MYTCIVCGKEFEDTRKKYNRKLPARFCSTLCRQTHNGKKGSFKRKYIVNPNLFENLDEKKAWFLGFFCADGCVVNDRLITFSQSGEDGKHLISWVLKEIFSISNYPIVGRKAGKQLSYSVSFTCPEVVKSFEKLGITRKKSLTLDFSFESLATPQLRSSFIRGYFEGDGCVRIVEIPSGYRYLSLDFVGTKQMMSGFQEIFKKDYGLDVTMRPLGSVFDLRLQNRNTPRLAQQLFENKEIYKGRKYQIIEDYLINNPIQWKQQKREEYIRKIKKGIEDFPNLTLNALAKQLGIGFSLLYRFRKEGLI